MSSSYQEQEPVAPPAGGQLRRIGWVLLLVAVLHTVSLLNPFFIDDYVYLDTVHDLDWAAVADIFTTSTMGEEASGVWWTPAGALPFYRPIGEMTFAADFALWGMKPLGYHLTNLLLHLACTLLVWRLALRFLETPGMALVVAIIFSLHPMHNEAVVWISGRFDLLVCLSMLASVLCYLNWRRRGQRSGLWVALSLTWFVVGLGCKETAIILPAVLVGVELLTSRGLKPAARGVTSRAQKPTGRVVVFAFGSIAMLYFGGRFALFGGLGTLPPPYGLDLSSPLIAARGLAWNLVQYLMDFALFIQVDAIYGAAFWSSNTVLLVTVGVGSLLICAACVMLAWRSRAFRLGAVWVVLFTAPALMAMPGERNVYLAGVGVALIAGAAFHALLRRYAAGSAPRRRVRWASMVLVGFWMVWCVVEHGVMWCVASSGEQVFRDLETLLPDPPPGARIYVVNQCPLNAVGFDQALRLRYGRSDLSGCALSLSPTLEASSMDRIVRTGPATIRLVRERAFFFQSFIERFHLFSQPASHLPGACRRLGLELLNPPSSYDQLSDLEFRLPYPLEDPRVQIFIWNNERVRNRADLAHMMDLAELQRYDPPGRPHRSARR